MDEECNYVKKKRTAGENITPAHVNAILVDEERRKEGLADPHKRYNLPTILNYLALLAARSEHLSLITNLSLDK